MAIELMMKTMAEALLIADDAHIDELVDVLEEVRRDERGGERRQALRGASLQKG